MADPIQPDVQLPQGYEVGTTIVEPLPAERAYPLKNPDFLTLCDGVDGKERAGRDLHIGLFVSAIVGIAGLLSCVDWPTVFAQKKWMLLACFFGACDNRCCICVRLRDPLESNVSREHDIYEIKENDFRVF